MLTPGANGSVYLGHLASIPIYAHWTALLMLWFAYSWSAPNAGGFNPSIFLIALTVLLMGIVLHELGHGLMAKLLGAHGITITLWAFGGLCQSGRSRDSGPGRELLIVAAGPAVSFLLFGLSWAALWWLGNHDLSLVEHPFTKQPTWLGHFLRISMLLNLVMGVFNMLPIFPLDGGQLVYNGALLITRRMQLARQITLVLAVVGALAAFAGLTYLSGGQPSIYNAALFTFLVYQAFTYLR
jgi:Zn-dependent protease